MGAARWHCSGFWACVGRRCCRCRCMFGLGPALTLGLPPDAVPGLVERGCSAVGAKPWFVGQFGVSFGLESVERPVALADGGVQPCPGVLHPAIDIEGHRPIVPCRTFTRITDSVDLMFLVVLLLVVAPLLELFVILQVAHVIGGWETIALLVMESVIGAWLIKRQGIAVMAKIAEAVHEGRMPGKELVDGFLILVAGALMLAPGFIGDVIGFLLLIPPTRALVRIPVMSRFKAGRYVRLFNVAGPGAGRRFVGTFRAGTVVDAGGHEAAPRDRPQLDS